MWRLEAESAAASRFRPLQWRDGLVELIGMTLTESYESLGIPKAVFPLRGAESWQDDVVFAFSGLYLYWFQDRVWQISIDADFEGDAYGLAMGSPRGTVMEILGEPFAATTEELVYLLPDRGYPVRARLLFANGLLTDVYVYRADF